jgi:hypothetical protein
VGLTLIQGSNFEPWKFWITAPSLFSSSTFQIIFLLLCPTKRQDAIRRWTTLECNITPTHLTVK